MIVHFAALVPTWLLIDYDWFATVQSAPYVAACTDLVHARRVRWISGTKMHGYDNFVWARFDACHTAGPFMHACGGAPSPVHTRVCLQCGKPYRAARSDSSYCDACRQRAHRRSRDPAVTMPSRAWDLMWRNPFIADAIKGRKTS